uniref:Uncharacterized protein n=1 Tax=Setaria viridis TaxID=4556 RepID=A0A4U6U5E1_SETVI|nr:hypothetical protein SEVIR_6G113850v2 [Setaria viridis]
MVPMVTTLCLILGLLPCVFSSMSGHFSAKYSGNREVVAFR